MRTDKTTVFDLFQTHRRYVVPIFQRGYVWTREAQWEPLWDDLMQEAAEVVRHKAVAGARLRKHFLGALVLNLTQGPLSRVPVVEVIDGQQRLTTIQVLLAALRDETTSIDNKFLRADLERLTANPQPLAVSEEKYKVWPTSGLQVHLQNVIEAGSSSALEERYKDLHRFRYGKWDPPRPGFVEAYLFFAEAMRKYLDDDDEELPFDLLSLPVRERAEVLVEALIRNIQLVTIELEGEDDAQVIFETLNARGEPLTPSDLVRNFVFLTATRDGQDVSSLYNDLWKEFEEVPPERPFWKQVERQGRLKSARMDLFLFHYVTFKTGEEFKIGHLYQSFRDWWESKPRVIEGEISELLRYGKIYRQLLAPDASTAFGRFAHRLRALDTTTVYPLIMWIAGEIGTDSKEFLAIIEYLESYFVRRAVCGYNAKAYNRLFLGFLERLQKGGEHPAASAVFGLLAASDADSAKWPADDEFKQHLINDPLYKSFRPGRTAMLLEALDLASQGRFAEHVQMADTLTVEHVLPQGAKDEDWPLEVAPEETPSDAVLRRASTVHSLGNLTLVTPSFNSSLSNAPYKDKRPEIARQSKLSLNTHFQTAMEWNESEMRLRGTKLADLAVRMWPRPSG